MLRRHHAIGPAVSLSCYDGDLWHGGLGERIKQFGSMTNDPKMFLIYSRKETGHVLKRDQGDVEAIAKPNESRCFYRCIDVQYASKKRWLVCYDTNRISA